MASSCASSSCASSSCASSSCASSSWASSSCASSSWDSSSCGSSSCGFSSCGFGFSFCGFFFGLSSACVSFSCSPSLSSSFSAGAGSFCFFAFLLLLAEPVVAAAGLPCPYPFRALDSPEWNPVFWAPRLLHLASAKPWSTLGLAFPYMSPKRKYMETNRAEDTWRAKFGSSSFIFSYKASASSLTSCRSSGALFARAFSS